MGLYQKIFNVMNNSKSLEKDMNVAGQYNAVSEKVMLNVVKPLLKENGLIIIPISAEVSEEPKGNKSITQVRVSYKIIDIKTGENEILVGIGNGADTQDKGAGKAFTYAYKAMLSKTFMLFSGEDTDNQHSDEITKAYQKENRNNQNKQQQPQQQSNQSSQQQQSYDPSKCSGCGDDIQPNVSNYSIKKYKKPLCFNCQKQQ